MSKLTIIGQLILALLSASAITYSQEATKATTQPKKQDKKQKEDDTDKIADKILAETNEIQVVAKWYQQVYPALKRKYKDPVSHSLYNTWRRRYFDNEVSPILIKFGYSVSDGQKVFMELTDKQPSN